MLQVLERPEANARYSKFLERYVGLAPNEQMKAALTDICFSLVHKVWDQLPAAANKGSCTFCIGGINAITPFSSTHAKNEILIYADHVPEDTPKISPTEGFCYNAEGQEIPFPDLSRYTDIYMDFNGSMAFFGDEWKQRLFNMDVIQKVICCTHQKALL